jgi:hypothetical protein
MDERTDRPIVILWQAAVATARLLLGLLIVLSAIFGTIALATILGWTFPWIGGPVIGALVILLAVSLIGHWNDPRRQRPPPDPP